MVVLGQGGSRDPRHRDVSRSVGPGGAKEPTDTTTGRQRMTEGALNSRGSKRAKEKRLK